MGKYENLLDSGTRNIIQSFYDNFAKDNASFRRKSGMKVTVIREALADCCDWCMDLEGVYDYETAPNDVWARHLDCKCMVVTKTERGTYQDAWSRKEYASQREARIAREQEILEEQEKEKRKPDFYTGANGKTIQERYSGWIGENKMQQYLGQTGSEEVKGYIRADFRPNSFIGDGSTADIRRFEIETGLKCGRNGNDHAQKAADLLMFIKRLLLKELPENDRIFLERMKKRLEEVSGI